jgi:hypothetical protein
MSLFLRDLRSWDRGFGRSTARGSVAQLEQPLSKGDAKLAVALRAPHGNWPGAATQQWVIRRGRSAIARVGASRALQSGQRRRKEPAHGDSG